MILVSNFYFYFLKIFFNFFSGMIRHDSALLGATCFVGSVVARWVLTQSVVVPVVGRVCLDEWVWWVTLVGWMSEFDVWDWLDEWVWLAWGWSNPGPQPPIPHYHLLKAQRPYPTTPTHSNTHHHHHHHHPSQSPPPLMVVHSTNLTRQTHSSNQSEQSNSLIQPTSPIKLTHPP